jgi:hypothetical protein
VALPQEDLVRIILVITALLAVAASTLASAQTPRRDYSPSLNFEQREEIIINNAAGQIEIIGFDFGTIYTRQFETVVDAQWRNVGEQPVRAFELGILLFDPFNRVVYNRRMLVPGTDSGNWSPLGSGQTAGDGFILPLTEVYSGVIYVRAIRFDDGTIWRFNAEATASEIRTRLANPQGLDLSAPSDE